MLVKTVFILKPLEVSPWKAGWENRLTNKTRRLASIDCISLGTNSVKIYVKMLT